MQGRGCGRAVRIRHVVEKIVCKRKNNATNCAIATTIGNVKKKGFFLGDYIRVGN